MPEGVSISDGRVHGLWLINGCEHETAIEALASSRVFVTPTGDWTGNEYWWVKADVPDWLSFITARVPVSVWPRIAAALDCAPTAPRVEVGALRIGGGNDLGIFLAKVDGELLPFGFPPNHMFFVERMTGATDWRFTRAGRVECFVALDGDGEPVGLVSACVRSETAEEVA